MQDLGDFISTCIYHEAESSSELLDTLTDWFFNHTQTTDKKFAQFLIKKGIKT